LTLIHQGSYNGYCLFLKTFGLFPSADERAIERGQRPSSHIPLDDLPAEFKEYDNRIMTTANIRNIILSLAAGAALSIAASAQAVTSGSAVAPTGNAAASNRIGVINIQAAIVNTNEGKRDFEALTKKFEPTQAKLKSMNDEIENDKKQLQAQQDKLNDEARGKLVRDIETKQKSLQRQLDDAQTDFQQQQSELGNRIATKMIDIIDKYAKANGLSMIIDVSGQQSPVLWASEQVNITPLIVDAYNTASGIAAPPAGTNAPSAVKPSTTRPATTPAKKPATSPTTPPKQ
jgi:outer membrane protein